MALSFRHQAILDVARNIGRVAVDDLAERLTVTPQTIRRDLNDLCDQEHLTRVHDRSLVHRDDGFRSRRAVTQCTVWSLGVVVFPPLFDDDLCFLKSVKDFAVQ